MGSNTLNYNAVAEDLDRELGINTGALEEREEKAALVRVLSQASNPTPMKRARIKDRSGLVEHLEDAELRVYAQPRSQRWSHVRRC